MRLRHLGNSWWRCRLACCPDRAVEHGQGGKQRRRAVALVIMCHGGAAAFLHRQAGLCAVAGLTVRPVIDRQHDRVSRRRNGEADDVGQRLVESGIVRKLELPPAIWHQAMRLPDRPYPRSGNPHSLCHRPQRPVGRRVRRRGVGQPDDLHHRLSSQRRLARRTRLVPQKSIHTFVHRSGPASARHCSSPCRSLS